jgi:Protein of unknown function (DUF416)
MTILTYDRKKLANELALLPKRLRVAFAAACAQRLLPHHIRRAEATRTGDPEAARRILRTLWNCLEQDSFNVDELQHDHDVCMSLFPNPDAKFIEGEEYAEFALSSLAYALSAQLTGDSQEAGWAGESAYESVGDHVIERFNIDLNTPGALRRINSCPAVQAELRRQQTDLAELHSAAKNPGSERAIIARIRRRAEADAASFFGEAG